MVTGQGNTALGESAGVGVLGTMNSDGYDAVSGYDNLALGSTAGRAIAGDRDTAVGYAAGAGTIGSDNVAVGSSAGGQVTGDANLALGPAAGGNVSGTENIAIGFSAGTNVQADGSIAIGTAAMVGGTDTMAVGTQALASGAGAIAIGALASATAGNAIAIGSGAFNAMPNSVVFGALGTPVTIRNVAAGTALTDAVNVSQLETVSTTLNADFSTVNTTLSALNALNATNTANITTVSGLIAATAPTPAPPVATAPAGNGIFTSIDNAVSIGTSATANAQNSIAFGTRAFASAPNSVALGTDSVATAADTVSVGAPANVNHEAVTRRITNVAPGVDPTDAVNYSQLADVSSTVSAQGQEIDANNLNANRGVAMAMAQSGAAVLNSAPGRTTVGFGAGYYSGASALGIGITHANALGTRAFSLGTSIVPGASTLGGQVALRWQIGRNPDRDPGPNSSALAARFDAFEQSVTTDQGETSRRLNALEAENQHLKDTIAQMHTALLVLQTAH